MEGFSRRMALEFAAYGIRVNTLCPTFTKTPMTKPQAPATSSSFMPSMGTVRELCSLVMASRVLPSGGKAAHILNLAADGAA